MARLLIGAGVALIVAGVVVKLGLPLGRLPGDIVVRRAHGTFYFPIVTCLLVSIVLSVLGFLLRR